MSTGKRRKTNIARGAYCGPGTKKAACYYPGKGHTNRSLGALGCKKGDRDLAGNPQGCDWRKASSKPGSADTAYRNAQKVLSLEINR
jgi:hypothetical protein